jgi:hypothetical protein
MAKFQKSSKDIGDSFKKFFESNQNSLKDENGHVIKDKNLRKGKLAFKDFLIKLGIDTPLKGLTFSVSFTDNLLGIWLADKPYKVFDNADEIKVVFGRYTEDFTDEEEGDFDEDKIGRLTVFLVPFKGGKRALYTKNKTSEKIPAFNLGGLYP